RGPKLSKAMRQPHPITKAGVRQLLRAACKVMDIKVSPKQDDEAGNQGWREHRRSGDVPQIKVADPIDFRRAWPAASFRKGRFVKPAAGENSLKRSNVMRSAQSSPATDARSGRAIHPGALLCPDAFLSPLAVDEAARRALDEDLGRAGD